MRQFIKLTISFLIVLFTIIFLFAEITEYLVTRKSEFKLNTSPKYLILGHSHPECAFNDTLIGNLKNLSQSGESYYYAYFKVRKIIEQNPSIEVIFIEFTNNQISESMDNWIWGEEYMNYRYPKYSPFMSITDKSILVKNNFPGYLNSISLSLKANFKRLLKQNFEYSNNIGGYLYLERDKTDSLVNTITNNSSNYNHSEKMIISEYNLIYLSKIIDFCEEKSKKVFLIRSPQHEKYPGYSNESTYQQIREKHYSLIEYLDFSKFPLNNYEYGDLEHLNHKGAKIFSTWFAQLLSNDFLEKESKQEIINGEIKARTHNTRYKKLPGQ